MSLSPSGLPTRTISIPMLSRVPAWSREWILARKWAKQASEEAFRPHSGLSWWQAFIVNHLRWLFLDKELMFNPLLRRQLPSVTHWLRHSWWRTVDKEPYSTSSSLQVRKNAPL
jgi:hypothetical protein